MRSQLTPSVASETSHRASHRHEFLFPGAVDDFEAVVRRCVANSSSSARHVAQLRPFCLSGEASSASALRQLPPRRSSKSGFLLAGDWCCWSFGSTLDRVID